ncbi:MAG: hypothetical protein ACRCWR_00780 [Saezia sp.]
MKNLHQPIRSFVLLMFLMTASLWCHAQTTPAPEKQVMLELRIVQATGGWRTYLKQQLSPVLSSHSFALTIPEKTGNPAEEIQVNAMSFGIAKKDHNSLQLALQELETENCGRNISSPSLVRTNSVPAYFEQGIEIPLPCIWQGACSCSNFRKTVISAEVTPHLNTDSTITLDI